MACDRVFLYEIGAALGLKVKAKDKNKANQQVIELCARLDQHLDSSPGLKAMGIEYVALDETAPDFLEEIDESRTNHHARS